MIVWVAEEEGVMRPFNFALLSLFVGATGAMADNYTPPAESSAVLSRVDIAHARPLDEVYRNEFSKCDGLANGGAGRDTFLGHVVPRRCSTDPSRVRALLRLPDGGILWESKMALDVDGSFAATSGRRWRSSNGAIRDTTDQCGTTYKWRPVPDGNDCANADAQVDPDIYPYAVIPAGGTRFLPAAQRAAAMRQFRQTTGLSVGDLGVIIYRDRWTPAFIADTGPIYRLGEASSGAFAALGQSRCRGNVDAHGRCIGDGTDLYPYRDVGISSGAIFIFYPGSGAGLTRENAIARICDFARTQLGLAGSPVCPH
jgi:hypothetical protein